MFDQSRFSTRCFYMAERKNAEPAKFHKKVEKPTRGALLRRRHYIQYLTKIIKNKSNFFEKYFDDMIFLTTEII